MRPPGQVHTCERPSSEGGVLLEKAIELVELSRESGYDGVELLDIIRRLS
jgi:hypothetical protein